MIIFSNYSTEKVICPYCGAEHDTDEAFFFDEDFNEFECYECGKKFHVKTTVTYSWETAKKEVQ